MAFEQAGSLLELAKLRHRDVSVVSRQLQSISNEASVLQKDRGRWKLTPLGQQIVRWARDALLSQQRIMQQKTTLRLVATREFAARVLAPGLIGLLGGDAANVVPQITSDEMGVEHALLSGEADLGFDCGRPGSPSVRFRLVRKEPLVVVAAPSLQKRHRLRGLGDLLQLPHLYYQRISPARVLGLSHEVSILGASFNDIATTRAACVAGLGWAILPSYTVRDEVRSNELFVVESPPLEQEKFGVFWLRENGAVTPWIDRAVDWLSAQDLG